MHCQVAMANVELLIQKRCSVHNLPVFQGRRIWRDFSVEYEELIPVVGDSESTRVASDSTDCVDSSRSLQGGGDGSQGPAYSDLS